MKRKTQYQHLLEEYSNYVRESTNLHMVHMWTYPKDKLGHGWQLEDLNERIATAKQLGYGIKLLSTGAGIEVFYVKNPCNKPYRFL